MNKQEKKNGNCLSGLIVVIVIVVIGMLIARSCGSEKKTDAQEKFDRTINAQYQSFTKRIIDDKENICRLYEYTSPIPITDHAFEYYKAYFESDNEKHYITNFGLNTTTEITVIPGSNILKVEAHERVDKEATSVSLLGTGLLLSKTLIDKNTGEPVYQ